MLFMIVQAVLFAILLVVVIVPPIFIFDPSRDLGEPLGPPTAGEVIREEDVSHSVKQKLYLLFIIPFCAILNATFLYFTYYRPIRFIQYRVEVNTNSLNRNRLTGFQQLKNIDFPAAGNSFMRRNSSMFPLGKSFLMQDAGKLELSQRDTSASGVSPYSGLRRHARPKGITKDAYANGTIFPEIRTLREEVEKYFLIPANIAERNYITAMTKLLNGAAASPNGAGGQTLAPSSSAARGGGAGEGRGSGAAAAHAAAGSGGGGAGFSSPHTIGPNGLPLGSLSDTLDPSLGGAGATASGPFSVEGGYYVSSGAPVATSPNARLPPGQMPLVGNTSVVFAVDDDVNNKQRRSNYHHFDLSGMAVRTLHLGRGGNTHSAQQGEPATDVEMSPPEGALPIR